MGAPVVTWPAEGSAATWDQACPNCGSTAAKPLLLQVDFATLPGQRRLATVLTCPDCTCPFYSAQIPPDYAAEGMLERGRIPFYIQQGAGISLITRPLAQVTAPPGSTYLEVGCGFGFGLDYARYAKGWNGRGIDPGGIAGLGEQMMGVTIERRYLGDDEPELAGACDVVMASETIEHVTSPATFVRVLRNVLRPDGVLILTTPDAAGLDRSTPTSLLIGLLSPGLHLIFQTRQSMERLLREAGFAHVVVDKDGHSLVAFASDAPIVLQQDHAAIRTEYRNYLERRALDFQPRDEMYLGFAARAMMEASNDGEFDQAARARACVDRACLERYGARLRALGERVETRPAMSVERMVEVAPLSLAGLLYADAMLRLGTGESRAGLRDQFLHAARAADQLSEALTELAMADGMSGEISWIGRAEAVLCAAAAGAPDTPAQLAALPPAPDAATGPARWRQIAERTLVTLVNAGHYDLAREISRAHRFDAEPWADPDLEGIARTDSQRDALFCLAVLDGQSEIPDIIARARERFRRVRLLLEQAGMAATGSGLYRAAERGETAARERLGINRSTPVADAGSST